MTVRTIGSLVAALALSCVVAPVTADEVDDILGRVDANLTMVRDQTYTGEIEVIRGDEVTKRMEFVVKLKGLRKKLVKFTAPGDVRGMAVLTTEDNLMYVYMPAYRRVRRVASHVRNQGFMGTDFSPEEMSNAALSLGWQGKILEDNEEDWVLELVPKQGHETVYSKMRVTVLKTIYAAVKLESFGPRGELIKTETRSEWSSLGQITLPTLFTVEDHRTGSKSVMRLLDCKVNQGIPDSAFTKRALIRRD
ncbi:MAG: outer membrane lipoprotein-sorting protein [Deltaproteobacteria bacterium]|nr:outer membrane lipoprotein-sorting protein [Deltaproteobacteria bacterium]